MFYVKKKLVSSLPEEVVLLRFTLWNIRESLNPCFHIHKQRINSYRFRSVSIKLQYQLKKLVIRNDMHVHQFLTNMKHKKIKSFLQYEVHFSLTTAFVLSIQTI